MSVASEISRIQNAKASLKTSINAKTDNEHQITDETIDEYADFVDSITSGGGITINSLNDYQNVMEEIGIKTDNFLKSKMTLYPVYTENSITLYTPNILTPNYIIHKRSNGKYRIIWVENSYEAIYNSTSLGALLYKQIEHSSSKISYIYDIKDIKNILPNDNVGTSSAYEYPQTYYSNEFNSISELIDAISNPTGNITYTGYKNGFTFGCVMDSPYLITYSNIPIVDLRNNGFEIVISQRISNNETIVQK